MATPKQTAAMRRQPGGRWAAIDAAAYRAERFVVVGATAAMTLVVFVGVYWRAFASPGSKLESALQALAGQDSEVLRWGARAATMLTWWWLSAHAVRTAKPGWPRRRRQAVAGAWAWGTVVVGWSLVYLLPAGLVFAQRLALSLMMWIVMLGASMAAHSRRHIVLQAAQRLVPSGSQRHHASVAMWTSAAFTAFLAYVGLRYSANDFVYWLRSDMRSAVFDSIAIPHWTVTAAIPVGFGLMTARFLAQGIAIWRGELPPRAPLATPPLVPNEEAPSQ